MALILIADDDEIVVEVVVAALGARGHVVAALDDGLPVMHTVELTRPALVILDCTMPELSGVEALRQIRTSQDFFDLPVLMLTERRSAEDEDIAMRMGATDYLRKPFDPDQLVSWVEILLTRADERRLAALTPSMPRLPMPSDRAEGLRSDRPWGRR